MIACTIAARNYLAHVRVLAESYRRFHRDGTLVVLVVDGEPGERFDGGAAYRALVPSEAGIPLDELHRMALIYDVTELSTALKPALLAHVLAEGRATGDDVAVYLDPDMVLFDAIDEVDQLAREHETVLVPHILRPIPEDGLQANELTLVQSGAYNLGFVAVHRRAEPFLGWWREHTRFDACIDHAAGLFTDQRWIDLVPSLFPHVLWRDAGVDVAYWNLHERPLSMGSDGRVLAGGVPLRLMHFSGYNPARPHMLSKHQGERPRILLSENPVLAGLTDQYRERLLDAGLGQWCRVPYRYGSVAGGPIPVDVRRLARAELLNPHSTDQPPSPFGVHGEAPFLEWLNRPAARHHDDVVTRLLLHVWNRRPDLQVAFPDPQFDHAGALTSWAVTATEFIETYGHLHDPPMLPVTRATVRPTPAIGYNIVGYAHAELGVGEACRLMAIAADAAGVPHQIVPYGDLASRQLDRSTVHRTAGAEQAAYDVNLLCVNADRTPHVLAALSPGMLAGRPRVGLWFWEADVAQEQAAAAAALLDEIWVTSEFVADVIRPHTDRPVLVAPLAVPDPRPTRLVRGDLGLPEDRYVFLTCFDAFSVPGRKNPMGVVTAYMKAFAPDDGAHLLVKAINGWARRDALEELWYATRHRADIEVRDGYVSRSEMNGLVQLTDAVVSLHRAEGFGLLPANAMAAAKPVVATGYSGNLAFMRPENSLLVPYELVRIGAGNAPYPPHGRWAEPDLDVAAAHMAALRGDPRAGAELGARAREDIARSHGAGVSGEWIGQRLDHIVSQHLSLSPS